jgi:hypothetical protein
MVMRLPKNQRGWPRAVGWGDWGVVDMCASINQRN